MQFTTFNITHKGPLVSRGEEVQTQGYSSRPSAAAPGHTFQHGRHGGPAGLRVEKSLHCYAGRGNETEQLETAATTAVSKGRETELLLSHILIHRPLGCFSSGSLMSWSLQKFSLTPHCDNPRNCTQGKEQVTSPPHSLKMGLLSKLYSGL